MKRSKFIAAAGVSAVAAAAVPARATPNRKRALVLTGAGALGAYEAGAAIELLRSGEAFDLICGTSIGAINGAFLAMGAVDRLEELWLTIASQRIIRAKPRLAAVMDSALQLGDSDRGVLSRPYNVLRNAARLYDGGAVFKETGFFEHAPIAKILSNQLDLRTVRTTFAWSITNLNSALSEACYVAPSLTEDLPSRANYRVHRLLPSDDGDVALFPEAIRASAAIPLVFEPVPLAFRNGSSAQYVDGGVAQNAPIGIARHLGATDIVAITAAPPSNVDKVSGIFDVIFQAYAANQNRLIFAQLQDGTTGTPLLSNALIRPEPALELGVLDFDKPAALAQAFERGRDDARKGPVLVEIS